VTRPLLDPAAPGNPTDGPQQEQLPRSVRQFGYYPNLEKLQPGDLLLVSPVKPGRVAKAIANAQRQLHTEYNADWIHAAAYLGDGSIVEIDGGGVRINELWRYVPNHKLLFRRLLVRGTATTIGQLEGLKIAVAALKRFQTRYNQRQIIKIGLRSCFPGADYKTHPKSREAICSTFYNDACVNALDRSAASAKIIDLTPADLAASLHMIDLDIGWLKIPN
jgi:hypothetical protein